MNQSLLLIASVSALASCVILLAIIMLSEGD